MIVHLNPNSSADYRTFLRIKALPRFVIRGRVAEFPDEYADRVGLHPQATATSDDEYQPIAGLFDYQADIARLAIRKKKFAAFVGCGLGKTLIMLEFARHVRDTIGVNCRALIVSPLMVVRQTISEAKRFYGDLLPIEQIRAKDLPAWLAGGRGIAITNYESVTDSLPDGECLDALILDESAMLKSAYGKWGTRLIRMGQGVEYKLCLTGLPAPNDRIEYANHAVFLDRYPTVNSFLARFFVNRGQTDNRWELKAHALRPFYRSLSDWSIFLNSPATYGWKDNVGTVPPIEVHIDHVDLSQDQWDAATAESGSLFPVAGGIVSRARLAQIAKGNYKGESIATSKPEFIRRMVAQWPDESTIIWCRYNREQEQMEDMFPGCASISGDTPEHVREEMVDDFQSGKRRVLISKGKCLGFGLNLQICTRMVFSTLQDSLEEYHQCVKRANRIGSTKSLHVYLPVSEIERPMIETVLRKAHQVDADTAVQEKLFKEMSRDF